MSEGKSGNPWGLAAALTVACLAVLGGGGTYVAIASRPEPVTAPKSLKPYTAKDQSFTCVYPEGWKLEDGAGQSTQAFATFRKGRAWLRVSSDLKGSLMADMAKSPMAGMDGVPGAGELGSISKDAAKPPVEKLHESAAGEVGGMLAARHFGKFEDGKMETFQGRGGDSRISEFTADGGMFGAKIRGFRTTSMGTERRVQVIAYAAEEDWKLLKPIYQKVILSVAPGTPQ